MTLKYTDCMSKKMYLLKIETGLSALTDLRSKIDKFNFN